MNLLFEVIVKSTGLRVPDSQEARNSMMEKSGLDPRMGYEDVGIQSDGTLVIFDRCGRFGYLSDEFELKMLETPKEDIS